MPPPPGAAPASPAPSPSSGDSAPTRLHVDILPQPDDTTCGPTCLHAVYRYFGDSIPLGQVIGEISQLKDGGTLASLLGCHALKRGYHARIYTYDLKVFDPTWLAGPNAALREKLLLQMAAKDDPKLRFVSRAYLDYLLLGGEIRFEDLSRALIRRPLTRGLPIIVGLSSTYLYRAMREIPSTGEDDDIRGLPAGHFVVLHGYDPASRAVSVADPYADNPIGDNNYVIPIDRVLGAIMLGIVTYDANLLVISPPFSPLPRPRRANPQPPKP